METKIHEKKIYVKISSNKNVHQKQSFSNKYLEEIDSQNDFPGKETSKGY